MVSSKASAKSISDLFIRTGRIQCLILTLILSGFIIFGSGFIDIWAGRDYSDSYLITLIFFGALFIPLLQNTGISILQARNQMKFRSLLYLVISLVSLGLQILLARHYGPLGCALAIGGALILGQVIIMNIYYAQKQGIDITAFWQSILRMSICPAILTVIGILAIRLVDDTKPMILLGGITLYCLIYIPCIWKWSMNGYERDLVMAPVRRICAHRLNRN